MFKNPILPSNYRVNTIRPIEQSKPSSAHDVMYGPSSVGQWLVLQPISSSLWPCVGGAIEGGLVGARCADINVSAFGDFEKITW